VTKPRVPERVRLDASVVLAVLRNERGAARVESLLPGACTSAVNLAEVLMVLERHGVPAVEATRAVTALGLDVLPTDRALAGTAAAAAAMRPRCGLSPGDCFCLATARTAGAPAVTADRAWAALRVGVRVELLR
jgi:PIN domain nuclease of toxin-antitoxin system